MPPFSCAVPASGEGSGGISTAGIRSKMGVKDRGVYPVRTSGAGPKPADNNSDKCSPV